MRGPALARYNAKGVLIARNVDELHSASNNLNKEAALDERGNLVNGRTEKPNKHDLLTGSRPDPPLGCSQERVRPPGGDGLFYCFAAK